MLPIFFFQICENLQDHIVGTKRAHKHAYASWVYPGRRGASRVYLAGTPDPTSTPGAQPVAATRTTRATKTNMLGRSAADRYKAPTCIPDCKALGRWVLHVSSLEPFVAWKGLPPFPGTRK